MDRPHTILSCAVSLDGRIDDAGPERLRLSSAADFDEVDAVRARCDAILVGAGTVRSDNPRLLVRSPERRAARLAAGRTGDLLKAVVSGSGELDPAARVFTTGDAGAVVYTGAPAAAAERFADPPGGRPVAVADAGDPADPHRILADLARRGVRRLLVEGGTHTHTLFLTAGLADELRLAVAPFFIGDPAAPRFTGPGSFADGPGHPLVPTGVREAGGTAVLTYRSQQSRASDAVLPLVAAEAAGGPDGTGVHAGPRDEELLRRAIALAGNCPPSDTAYSVGAVLADAAGRVLAEGWSRSGDPRDHAEEAALRAVDPADPRLSGATLYTSLEPCGVRASRPRPCADLVAATPIPRAVFAWREPSDLAPGGGAGTLTAAGRTVVQIPSLAAAAQAPNRHILDRSAGA